MFRLRGAVLRAENSLREWKLRREFASKYNFLVQTFVRAETHQH